MVVENHNEMLQGSGNNSHSTDKTAYQTPWLKLTSPAALPLEEFGSRIVCPKIMTAGKEENNVTDQEVNTPSSTQTVKEYSVEVYVFSTAITPPQQETESGDAQMAEATSGVKTEAVPLSTIVITGTPEAKKYIKVLKAYRIILLGKTRSGKSSLGNNIFGEDVFKLCGTNKCQIQSKSVHERRITLVDTPGFSDMDQPEDHLKDEIVRCTTECVSGPHAFLIVLKVEKSTEQQLAVIDKIKQHFSEEIFKYAAVVFTHGDQLDEGVNIEQYVSQNTHLSDLVKKCSGQYHVVNSKCKLQSDNNHFQMSQILNTVDKIVMQNKGGCYINKMPEVQKREKSATLTGKQPQEENDDKGNNGPHKNMWVSLSGPAGMSVAETFFGPTVTAWQNTIRVSVNEENKKSDEKQEENKEREPTAESEPEESSKVTEEAPQNNTENESKPKRQSEKQNNGDQVDKPGHGKDHSKNGSGGLFGRLLSWAGAVLATGAAGVAAALASGAVSVAAALAAGASLAALALAAGAGYLAGAGTVIGALVGAVMWIKNKIQPLIDWLKEKMNQLTHLYNTMTDNLGVILLVVAVCLLLVLSFFARVPMAASFLLSGGIVVLFLLIMLFAFMQ